MNATLACALLLLAAVATPSFAAPSDPSTFTYVPPAAGAPARRVGGSSRGVAAAVPFVAVLAPEQAGFTFEAQPVLYWFASAPSTLRLEITLIDERGVVPMIERPLDGTQAGGVHAFALADAGVHLEPGIDYQWSVALITDPEQRSGDVLSQGVIRRLPADATLAPRLHEASPLERAALLAQAGIWYDALDGLSSAIAAAPENVALRRQRADLLAQVGLKEVATFERAAAK
jgi:hypothetical protein